MTSPLLSPRPALPDALALTRLAHEALIDHLDRQDPGHALQRLLTDLGHLMGRLATLEADPILARRRRSGALELPLQHLDEHLGALRIQPAEGLAPVATARALAPVLQSLAVLQRQVQQAKAPQASPMLHSNPGQMMRAALRGAGTFVWEWDIVNDRLADIDEGFEQLGYPPQPGLRTQAEWDAVIHPDDLQANDEAYQRHARGEDDFYEHVYRARAFDGQWRWLQERGRIVEWTPDGRPQRMVGTQVDITERLKMAQDKTVAETANRTKTEFLSRMSHELRTPLNAVLGFAQLMRVDPHSRLSPEQMRRVALIYQSGEHLLAMIDDLLDLTSIESGRLALRLEPVPLAELADDTLDMVQSAAQRHDLRLQRAPCAGLAALADRKRLRQVMLNLLTNAIKYNRPGGSVQVSAQADGDQVRIAVSDTGEGLTPDECAHLFEPFNRLRHAHSSHVEGTGIGLTVTQGLVGLMGGRIEVQSVPGQGSTFTVVLPMAPQPGSPPA